MGPSLGDALRPATLADVAALSGVAVSTVSRALTRPDRVSSGTRARVEQAAQQLDYRPNSQARALASGRKHAVSVLVSDITNPYYFNIIRGTQHRLRVAGYTQLLVDTEESDVIEDALLHRLALTSDGAIIAASRLPDERLARLAQEIPFVVINRETSGVSGVMLDTPNGCTQAMEHLVSLGHRDIAYVAGPTSSWANEGRWRAVEEAGDVHRVRAVRVGPFTPRQAAGAAAADAVLNAGVTACLAFNDLLAIGMLMRLNERGVDVPGHLSIVGCDDIFGSDFCHPPLTTITAPIQQAGHVAVDMLLSRIDVPPSRADPSRTVTLPIHLTIRNSTGSPEGQAA